MTMAPTFFIDKDIVSPACDFVHQESCLMLRFRPVHSALCHMRKPPP